MCFSWGWLQLGSPLPPSWDGTQGHASLATHFVCHCATAYYSYRTSSPESQLGTIFASWKQRCISRSISSGFLGSVCAFKPFLYCFCRLLLLPPPSPPCPTIGSLSSPG